MRSKSSFAIHIVQEGDVALGGRGEEDSCNRSWWGIEAHNSKSNGLGSNCNSRSGLQIIAGSRLDTANMILANKGFDVSLVFSCFSFEAHDCCEMLF